MSYARKVKKPNKKWRDTVERWLERRLGGHVSVGPLTIFGFNAMHVALDLRTRWGYLCIHPTVQFHGYTWFWYIYLSPNATPGDATWGIGPGIAPYGRKSGR